MSVYVVVATQKTPLSVSLTTLICEVPTVGRVSRTGKRRSSRTFHDEVTANLRSFVRDCGGAYALYRDGIVAEGTVKNWMAGRGSLPSLETAAVLANRKRLSLNWLVSGNGPRLLDQIMDAPSLAEALRAHVVAELRVRGVSKTEVDLAVWRGDALLKQIVRDRLTEVQNFRKEVGSRFTAKAFMAERAKATRSSKAKGSP